MIYKSEIRKSREGNILVLYFRCEMDEMSREFLDTGKDILDRINEYIILLQEKVDYQKIMVIVNGISLGMLVCKQFGFSFFA